MDNASLFEYNHAKTLVNDLFPVHQTDRIAIYILYTKER